MNEPTIYELQRDNEKLRRQLGEVEQSLRTECGRTQEGLTQAVRQMDEFLSVLAHDLRNPLVPIRNAIEILRMPDRSATDRQWAIDIIDRQTHDFSSLLDDLLDISRITRGPIELLLEPVELTEVVRRAVETNQDRLTRKKQSLTLALPADPVWVKGDRARLTQILSNLLDNSAKYTDEQGRIQLSAAATESEILLCVEDNGMGIDPDFLPRVFDLFAKTDGSIGGLGMGLTVVRKLVEAHGGSVQAFSDGPGRGSRFLIRLPRLSEADRLRTGRSDTLNELLAQQPRRILVIADDKDFAEEWSMLLRVAGHVVQTADLTSVALEAAQSFQPDVISLEIGRHDADGYQLAQSLRRQLARDHLRVVAIADAPNEEGARRAQEAGCDALLVKPVKIRDFLKLIAK